MTLFQCPYCYHQTANPLEGWYAVEDDPETEETRWHCETCNAEWWAYGHDTPQYEKVLFCSPRYPERKPLPLDTCAARYLFRASLFYQARWVVDLCNHGDVDAPKSIPEIVTTVKEIGVMAIWALPVCVRVDYVP